jgi:hypothetical protein
MRQVSRDPYARTTLMRRTVTGYSVDTVGGFGSRLYSCDWCGTTRHTKNGKPTAYRYETHSDGGRVHEHKGTFCSKSCHDSYHG